MIGLCVLVLWSAGAAPEAGFRLARVQLVGPVASASFLAEQGSTVLRCDLALGEERELVLPFPAETSRQLPRAQTVGAGSVEVREWIPIEATEQLPLRLASRTWPPLASGAVRAPWPAVLLVLAAAVLAFGLRRRPWAALASSLVLGLGAGVLARDATRAGDPEVRVLEGDARTGRWLGSETARGRLDFGNRLPASLEVAPAGRSVQWSVTLPAAGEPLYRLEARGCALRALWPLPELEAQDGGAGSAVLDRQNNGLMSWSEVWTRDARGVWRAHGEWAAGEAIGDALTQAEQVARELGDPPGWLASGLPQGVPILLGRAARNEPTSSRQLFGSPGQPDSKILTWVRLTGF